MERRNEVERRGRAEGKEEVRACHSSLQSFPPYCEINVRFEQNRLQRMCLQNETRMHPESKPLDQVSKVRSNRTEYNLVTSLPTGCFLPHQLCVCCNLICILFLLVKSMKVEYSVESW